jgi:hypothetical protein
MDKITCDCGSKISKKGYKKHLQTKKHLEGAGFFDFIKKGVDAVQNTYNAVKSNVGNVFSKRIGFNNISTKTLNEYGNFPIINIQVARQPIVKALDKVVNIISLGSWGRMKKQYNFDDLMHLGMIATVRLPNGTNRNIMIEKVDAVTISPTISMTGNKVEYFTIPLNGKQITINEMVDKAKQAVGDKKFFDYSGLGLGNEPPNNCQYFLLYLLQNSGLLSESAKNFIFQDVEQLAKKMPEFSKRIMNAVTDLGQISNKLLGKGIVHAVHVHKRVPVDEATQIAQDLINNKRKKHYRGTKAHHKFRNLPKSKFENLEKIKVNKDITILIGKLK